MQQEVLLEAALGDEPMVADVALHRRTGAEPVHAQVPVELAAPIETVIADLAAVRLRARVDLHVLVEVVVPGESLLASLATVDRNSDRERHSNYLPRV